MNVFAPLLGHAFLHLCTPKMHLPECYCISALTCVFAPLLGCTSNASSFLSHFHFVAPLFHHTSISWHQYYFCTSAGMHLYCIFIFVALSFCCTSISSHFYFIASILFLHLCWDAPLLHLQFFAPLFHHSSIL